MDTFQRDDFPIALELFRSLADEGQREAQFCLGARYYNGQGAPRNNIKAYFWFTLASDFINQKKAASKLTQKQIADAEKLLHEWKSK